jgi:hypothetical protein
MWLAVKYPQIHLALERLTIIHSHQGNCQTAIPYARRWLVLDPLHEPAHRQVMKLYAWAGWWRRRYVDAIAANRLVIRFVGRLSPRVKLLMQPQKRGDS